jgi:flavin reductase (DIM6/NTAB) family NADH-FMN oxidoreductase RutF
MGVSNDRPADIFEDLVGELDYPMIIVTAAAAGRRGGCLIGFATQCSISPPRFVVYLSDKNRTFRIACEAEALGVHFLSTSDDDLARLFGAETGDEVDKFAGLEWHEGAAGTPLIDRCANRFVGRVLHRQVAGDHVGFLLEPIEAARGEELQPFPFQRAKRIDPGHDP